MFSPGATGLEARAGTLGAEGAAALGKGEPFFFWIPSPSLLVYCAAFLFFFAFFLLLCFFAFLFFCFYVFLLFCFFVSLFSVLCFVFFNAFVVLFFDLLPCCSA